MKIKNILPALLLITINVFAYGQATKHIPSEKDQQQFSKSLRGNGLHFAENKGQIADMNGNLRPDVLYKGEGCAADIYLRKRGVSYVFKDKQEQTLKLHRVDMNFGNCNNNISCTNEDELEGYSNYYYAHCPGGITHVRKFKKVICKNIYNNIDVNYYGNEDRGLKYDIIVKPHGDAKQVKLIWTGAEEMHIGSEGKLIIKTSLNEFYESIPKVYQTINGETKNVKAKYVLRKIKNPGEVSFSYEITFALEKWNSEFPLVIDPSTWLTYLGGNMEDFGTSVATDGLHNAIIEGYTESPNLPVSVGAFQTAMKGFSDGYVAKFTAAGTLVFSTFFGGSDKDECRGGVVTDSNNDIYVSGVTWSTDFPLLAWGGAFMQLVNNSAGNAGTDDFVAKFSPAGNLIWSTYYGGSKDEWCADITVDALNNITFTGSTQSVDLPTLTPYQAAQKGGGDAFVVRFNNAGVRQWATYYGGSGTEAPSGIISDAGNNIYVSGYTKSNDFPSIAAFQPAYGGGPEDAFLVRLDPATGIPAWSSYYGGNGDDDGTSVAADALGNIFLGLQTNSANNISTAGSYQPVLKGNFDGGIAKFTSAGNRIWATYIGGTATDGITGLAVDMNNNISAGGGTGSNNFPVTSCAFQTVFGGANDMTMSKFNQQGELLCSSYINNAGTCINAGGSIAVDGVYAYINGSAGANFPVTAGAFQTVYGGNPIDDAFLKLCSYSCGLINQATANFSVNQNSVCPNTPINFTLTNSCDTANTTYAWTFTGGNPAASVVQNPSGITWSATGTYGVSVHVVSPCDTFTITNPNYITIIPCAFTVSVTSTNINCSSSCNGSGTATPTGGTGPYTFLWNTMPAQSTQTATGLCTGNYSVTVTDSTGSSTSANVIITASNISPAANAGADVTMAQGDSIILTATGGGTYIWNPGGQTDSIITVIPSVTTIYCVKVTIGNNCSDSDCVTITIPEPIPDCTNAGELFLPNAFSPNTDNENDKLQIYYGNFSCIQSFNIRIYDRWGEKVFESSNAGFKWDGSYKGKFFDSAVFTYYLKTTFISGKEINQKGNISLVK